MLPVTKVTGAIKRNKSHKIIIIMENGNVVGNNSKILHGQHVWNMTNNKIFKVIRGYNTGTEVKECVMVVLWKSY